MLLTIKKYYESVGSQPFEHTQFSMYLVAVVCTLTAGYDSSQGIIQRYHVNKKWFYLYTAMCFFAYLYVRPLIRRRLGSASRGYINWSTIYIVWLLAAVFYHLPSLESLGIDVKADISMLLTVFLLTLVVLGALAVVHGVAVALRWLPSKLIDMAPSSRQMFTMIILNATTIAIACSTYYSFCGNAAAIAAASNAFSPSSFSPASLLTPTTPLMAKSPDALRTVVCGKWLHPVSAVRHPAFSAWVIYGEAAGNSSMPHSITGEKKTATTNSNNNNKVENYNNGETTSELILEVDVALDRSRNAHTASKKKEPVSSTISPVFTTWLTLFSMIMAHTVADYGAAVVMSSAYSMQKRKAFSRRKSSSRLSSSMSSRRRRRSADSWTEWTPPLRPGNSIDGGDDGSYYDGSLGSYASFLSLSGINAFSGGGNNNNNNTMNNNNNNNGNRDEGSHPHGLDLLLKTVSSVGNLWSPNMLSQSRMGLRAASALLFRDDHSLPTQKKIDDGEEAPQPQTHQNTAVHLADPELVAGIGIVVPDDSPSPSFLPMFPWYSGTSADLLKTLFDLMVSVKVFLGRFDMRTMQAASASGGSGSAASGGAAVPRDGDGFTYEHLSKRSEAWIDFCADTGDGGDPTYSIARCMAAKHVAVEMPPPVDDNAIDKSLGAENGQKKSDSNGNGNSTGRDIRVLPRGDVFVHGGDLAYPNPTDETYEQRLWVPYEGAFPPPPHVHPGQLVVNKPDIPREYWQSQRTTCNPTSTNNNTQQHPNCPLHSAPDQRSACTIDTPCSACQKASALSSYDGPSAFFLPGNHDWIDGLETFQRHIVHKGWIGGWVLPQEKSYFSLHLPHGWWLFAIDLALVDDIDMCQYRYFARVAEERMGPDDRAIIVTHCPQWLTDWFWGKNDGKNLRQLLRGPLKGRCRIHLAGDLHFYMRHSFRKYTRDPAVANGISPPQSELSTPAGGSPLQGGSPVSTRCPTPQPFLSHALQQQQQLGTGLLHQSLVNQLKRVAGSNSTLPGGSGVTTTTTINNNNTINTTTTNNNNNSDSLPPPPLSGDTEFPTSMHRQDIPPSELTKSASINSMGSSPTGFLGMEGCSPPPLPPSALTGPYVSLRNTTPPHPLKPFEQLDDNDNDGDDGNDGMKKEKAGDGIGDEGEQSKGISSLSTGGARMSRPSSRSQLNRSNSGLGASPPSSYLQLASSPKAWWSNLSSSAAAAAAAATAAGGSFGGHNQQQSHLRTPRNGGSPIADAPVYDSMGYRRHGPAFSENEWDAPPAGWRLNAPEHLVVCGGGGAFLHPTHIFSYARFRPVHDAAAGPIYIPPSSSVGHPLLHASNNNNNNGMMMRRGFPSSSSLYGAAIHASASASQLQEKQLQQQQQQQPPPGGEYRCIAAAPTERESRDLGRANLHTFRHVNNRFDIIGGALYYFLVVSVLPRCSGIARVLDAHSIGEVVAVFATAARDTVVEIFSQSYVSLAALFFLFVIVFGFARGGGVGAIHGIPPSARRKPEYKGFALAVRARAGGIGAQLTFAAAHAAAHFSAAIGLLLLLELGIETVIRYEGVGKDGYHSLYKWYQTFEAQHFPDPANLRGALSSWTLSLYPNLIKWLFAVFDVPEAIAVSRTAICNLGGSLAALTRLQVFGYYGGVLLYFWVLATPTVGFLFGLYLYISGNWLHLHYDESFSSLQVDGHKGFLRLHITQDGDLEVYSLGLKEVPHMWREDPRWRAPGGGGFSPDVPAHHARWPSRWVPVTETKRGGANNNNNNGKKSGRYGHGHGSGKRLMHTGVPPEAQLKVIDYFVVPKDAAM